MENRTKKSQFYRFLSVCIFVLIIGVQPAFADEEDEVIRTPDLINLTESFYILADKGYGTNEEAIVRVELPSSYKRSAISLEADFRVYAIPNALQFLQNQPNMHRVTMPTEFKGYSAGPVISYAWNSIVNRARVSLQRIFSTETRAQIVEKIPELKIPVSILNKTYQPTQEMMFKPIAGLKIVSEFRYPIWEAESLASKNIAHLPNSSDNFIPPNKGSAQVALGKLPAGLYLVEAMVANQRATALVFVANTVAINKASANQMFVWTTHRQTGKSVKGVDLLWTDGVGVLTKSSTDTNGWAVLDRKVPEHTYLLGQDQEGGIFISENYYYDSEVYNTKLYAFTDKPLYRPGETVRIKAIFRHFINAQQSEAISNQSFNYQIHSPAGQLISKGKMKKDDQNGASASFVLADTLMPGGYEIRIINGDDVYAADFRVANYIKPHFEILLNTPKDLKTGQDISAQLSLRYPNGKPVKNAQVQLEIKQQRLSMVDGQLAYAGRFPVALKQQYYHTDAQGDLKVQLPKALEPSRYILTVLATDQAAYRVRMTKEVLIERGLTQYQIKPIKNFGLANEQVRFDFKAIGDGKDPVASFEVIQLETQDKQTGNVNNQQYFDYKFGKTGSYSVALRDELGNLLGATNYWVQGEGIQVENNQIEIVLNKDNYQIGETAEALVTFADKADEALITMERENVNSWGLLSQANSAWFKAKKINQRQYLLSIPIKPDYSPNMTLSVLRQDKGNYNFENIGIIVAQPQLDLSIKTDKSTYKPNETVTVDISSMFKGKEAPAGLSISVVDEMVYVLQPEVAPTLTEFFYHPRRNNVNTQSSINFIHFDKSINALSNKKNLNSNYNERAVKVLERPRREDKDVAYWTPHIATDVHGKTKLTFKIPDALTRWRITVKAINNQGHVGQQTAYFNSEQDFYLKWTGPASKRLDDVMQSEILVFNQTQESADITWKALNGGQLIAEGSKTLQPGANYLSVDSKIGETVVSIFQNGKQLDSLAQKIKPASSQWTTQQQVNIPINGEKLALNLPKDAKNIRLSVMSAGDFGFSQTLNNLIEYPYGCVEQISSRILPLSIAYQRLPASTPDFMSAAIRKTLQNQRYKLMDMAGTQAKFTWWGERDSNHNLFITTYAYYADWFASKQLGLPYAKSDLELLLKMYQEQSANEPLLHMYLTLWMFDSMGLPTQTLLTGLDLRLLANDKALKSASADKFASLIFAYPDSREANDFSLLISRYLHQKNSLAIADNLNTLMAERMPIVANSNNIAVKSFLALSNQDVSQMNGVLDQVSSDYPSIERSLSLLWLNQLSSTKSKVIIPVKPKGKWLKTQQAATGLAIWRWMDKVVPKELLVNNLPADEFIAQIQYDSDLKPVNNLAVAVDRKLYRLEQKITKKNDDYHGYSEEIFYQAVPVKPGELIHSNELYVDEISLTPKNSLKFGLIEVALPPGAQVEGSTWGMVIGGLDTEDVKPFARASYEEGELSYRLPVAKLEESSKYRQLVRFSQKGHFKLPATRLFKMYEPTQSSYEKNSLDIKVD